MKVLFTLISIDIGDDFYLLASKRLINELLEKTPYDVLVSTNNDNYFSDIISDRCVVRNNIRENSILKYGTEFNYNLKHHAFLEIPEKYDYIIYIDGDIKLMKWDDETENFINGEMSNYDFFGDRLNAVLIDEVNRFIKNEPCLFSHKIKSYDIMERFGIDDEIMMSKMPSEHILILKNDPEKIMKFQEKWEELNEYLQSKNGVGGSWGDGFEIGISSNYAGFNQYFNLSPYYWSSVLGFEFNGNKF
jgi:hypothetical protein